ncbi:MAG: sigma-54 dependent transcriptional regulator [Holosporaceae bacterium]|jgi:transcriptional regulator with GAF, ATPase, and Fis domain|nr:sigma-54 dependent transcriptional regulator [Holosporaceae bacterium]
MKIIVVGEKLENSLFEVVKISKKLDCSLVFFKKAIKTDVAPDDLLVVDAGLVGSLPDNLDNTVISVVDSPNYVPSLKNEKTVSLSSLVFLEQMIQKSRTIEADPVVMDPASRRIFQIADKIAATDATVLITGETGVGKEVLAKYIHQKSNRSQQKYVVINCAAIPETLLESELFGHEKGAFTSAFQRRIGKFEEADRGTILLDELSEMPLHLQAKLLRVIQEKEISRVGGGSLKVDVRIIATSNRDLGQAMRDGTFREDLFYRLNVVPIEVPRLNDRPLDIGPMAIFFCRKYSCGQKTLSSRLLQSLKQRCWRGNIRELENAVHRAVLFSHGDVVDATTLDTQSLQQISHTGV